jgi:hypothetical protein
LAEIYQADRAGFAKAAQELLTTGKTTAFQALAEAYSDASYTPLSTDEAMTAWQDADFPQALIDAGLEPIFEGGDLAINIPGMGVVPWAEAVQRGLVKVSRHG